MHFKTVTLAIALAVADLAYSHAGQDPRPPVFRSGVSLIQVEVSVFDKEGAPAKGLSVADFQVFEDGKSQRIVSFTPVLVPSRTDSPSWARTVPHDVTTNLTGQSRVWLILLDDATLPFEAQMITTAKQAARNVVERMGPQDQAAVVFAADNRNALDFTTDKARLLTAIETFRAGWYSHSNNEWRADAGFARMAGRALLRSVESLSQITDRAKSLVFISCGVGNTLRPDEVGRLYRLAQAANLTIHPVDPSGLGLEEYLRSRILQQRGGAAKAAESAHQTARAAEHKLQGFATNTGGKAVLRTNDFETPLDKMFEESSSYYLIAYESTQPNDAYRRTEIRTGHPDLVLRGRKGAWIPSKSSHKLTAAAPEIAIAGVLPVAGIPLRVHLAPFLGDRGSAVVSANIDVDMRAVPNMESATLNIVIAVFDPEGRDRGVWRQRVTPSAADRADDGYVNVESKLELKPGRYSVRVGVERESGPAGSVYSHLDVPNFAISPLSISGVLISTERVDAGSISERPRSWTTRRSFGRTEFPAASIRVYQGADRPLPVTLTTRIDDADGRIVSTSTRTLAVTDFARGDGAAHTFSVPVTELPEGSYLLTFEAYAAGGSTAIRQVRFEVD